MKKILAIVAITAAVTLTTACGESDPPCESLPAPTQAQQEVAKTAEVEVEVEVEVAVEGFGGGTAECVVVGDRWVDQTDE